MVDDIRPGQLRGYSQSRGPNDDDYIYYLVIRQAVVSDELVRPWVESPGSWWLVAGLTPHNSGWFTTIMRAGELGALISDAQST